MLTGNSNIDLFLKHVRLVTKEHGVKLILQKTKMVKLAKNSYCSGYFNDVPKPKIVVAVDKPIEQWLPVLVHEFCHLEQFLEGDLTWTNLEIYETDSCTEFQDWLDGNDELHPELITYHMKRVIDMEFNCEKRAVKKIKKFKLPINIEDYIQRANVYMWFYSAVKEMRKWSGKNNDIPVYRIKEIANFCPKTWIRNPYKPRKGFIELLKKYYY